MADPLVLLAGFTYKPGYDVAIRKDSTDRYYYIHVLALVPDVDKPETLIETSQSQVIDVALFAQMSNEEAMNLVWQLVWKLELHEMQEWFRVRGVCWKEPVHG